MNDRLQMVKFNPRERNRLMVNGVEVGDGSRIHFVALWNGWKHVGSEMVELTRGPIRPCRLREDLQ